MQYAQPKHQGDPTIASLANGLGTLGRYGDSYMVHAAEGETVVPAEILAANPELKNQLFWQMRMMGIKDPNRYVVGNTLNSINPVTGQPEFWFKKIFRAVKKVFKKALPVIAPIVGNLIAPGIGGIIASGLVTKLQGGSWGDVLKSAALSYGIGALGQGLGGALSAGTAGTGIGAGFAEGLGKGIMSPFEAAGGLFKSGAQNPLAQGIFGPQGPGGGLIFESATGDLGVSPTTGMPIPASMGGGTLGAKTLGYKGGLFPTYNTGFAGGAPAVAQQQSGNRVIQTRAGPVISNQPVIAGGTNVNVPLADPVVPGQQVDLGGNLVRPGTGPGDYVPWRHQAGEFSSGPGAQSGSEYMPGALGEETRLRDADKILQGGTAAGDRNIASRIIFGPDRGKAVADLGGYALEKATSGPVLAAGIPYAYTYFTAEDPEEDPEETREKLPGVVEQNKYDEWLALPPDQQYSEQGVSLLREAGIRPAGRSVEKLAEITGITVEQAQAYLDSKYGTYASPGRLSGGGIVSLQGGGEITGPGTGTSDSIPARLSDGEFVMTADAVRGIGNGNRDLGAARMYDLMSRYERTA